MIMVPLNYRLANKFIGVKETPGVASTPLVLAMLKLDASWVEDDETAWCSAFLNFVHWLADAPRSRSLAARSWLTIGQSVPLTDAQLGDVVVLTRGEGKQPGPTVVAAPGHVGLYVSHDDTTVSLLGGNQGNMVSVAAFVKTRILSIRRMA